MDTMEVLALREARSGKRWREGRGSCDSVWDKSQTPPPHLVSIVTRFQKTQGRPLKDNEIKYICLSF